LRRPPTPPLFPYTTLFRSVNRTMAPTFHWSLAVSACLLAVAFAAAYGQAPLYYSNQNQYFLHGLAAAGEGYLSEDWLARTLDPRSEEHTSELQSLAYLVCR